MNLRAAVRRLPSDQAGTTLIEMMVATAVLAIVLAIYFGVVTSVEINLDRQDNRSRSVDQARLAVQSIDRDVRSATIVYAPTNNGMTLVVYTQSNANVRGGARCVQWNVSGTSLQRRDWSPSDPNGTVSVWRTVATDVVNATQSPQVPVFTRDAYGLYSNRVTKVQVLTMRDASQGRAVEVDASITARNTGTGSGGTTCQVIPP